MKRTAVGYDWATMEVDGVSVERGDGLDEERQNRRRAGSRCGRGRREDEAATERSFEHQQNLGTASTKQQGFFVKYLLFPFSA